MIRAFLFDIGNVLLRFDFSIAVRRIAAESEVRDPIDILARIDQLKAGYEDGQIERSSFLRGVIDAIRYRGTPETLLTAWNDIFEPNEPMGALVEQLHGRFPLYLLSNTNDAHCEYFLARYPVFRRFSGGIFSHEVKASKPNRAIYEIACRQLGLTPDTTFFIDDLQPNIETARQLGFHTHHYHSGRHEELLAELRNAGLLS